MTLSTVPRYDGDRLSRGDGHAVVLGGSVAGLCTARVLADEYGTVTVLERDPLPDAPVPRDGVPQAAQPHALLEAGRSTIEDLFPSYGESLVAAGGLVIDAASDFRLYDEGGFLADGPRRMPMYSASRPLFEHVLRECVASLDRVELRGECHSTGYRFDESAGRVTGAVVRNETGDRETVSADLVVDATGRASRTPAWLAEHGYERPPVDEVHVGLEYSTIVVERPPDERDAIWGPASPPNTRGAGAAPVEGGRWQVVLHGVHGTSPPSDPDEFEAFAAGLPFPDVERLLADHPRRDDEVVRYPFPSNRRHRYESLDRVPEGLVVVGDAVASYNPIYGQGISVATLGALVLHHALADGGRASLGERFFDRVSPVTDVAWTMAVGADFQFPQTTGPKPRGADLLARYLSRLTRRAHTDGALSDALFRVIMMEREPASLLRPGVVWRVLRPRP
jgi:2-polyprenyl-6-methoxyphenol hydroxylase-like FAD-dependent oxidoreductase